MHKLLLLCAIVFQKDFGSLFPVRIKNKIKPIINKRLIRYYIVVMENPDAYYISFRWVIQMILFKGNIRMYSLQRLMLTQSQRME